MAEPAGIKGMVDIPGDKSISHRAVMLASLARGTSRIRGFLRSGDTLATVAMMRSLGVAIHEVGPSELRIEGVGLAGLSRPDAVIDAGNSGTTMRIGAGLLAGQAFSSTITGDRYLLRRPMARVIKPLRLMGASVKGREKDTLPPLNISGGGLKGIRYPTPVASAQVKSAILVAGMFAEGTTTVVEPMPTRDHTERMLRSMGVDVVTDGREVALHPPGSLAPLDMEVPADFSAAAFFIVLAAAAHGTEVSLPGVGINGTRTGLLTVMRRMGADVRLDSRRDIGGEPVADLGLRGRGLSGTEITADEIPSMIDEVPAFCVAAAMAHGRSEVRGASELRTKESDRISSMIDALAELGVNCGEYPDGLWIEGPSVIRPGRRVDTRGDHRVAMAFMVLSTATGVPIELSDTACIETSFPGFMDLLADIAPPRLTSLP
ncbi:MAG: 3-phosphoshikimate 1-carboxyvinyltransferase [Deltaproteobacteria bacterium]|nr:3-phosphoshikimate 1-carboxyvinyltransferase [Deltaproteobacteria bacterium]